MGERKKPASQAETLLVKGGTQVWTLRNSKQFHVFSKDPEKGGPRPDDVTELMRQLEMPDGASWARLAVSGDVFGDKWRLFNLELFGMCVRSNDKGEYPWPFWSIADIEGIVSPVIVQLWRQIVRHTNSVVFGQVLWNPKLLRRVSLNGLEHPHSNDDIALARQGLALLEAITHSGRPFGSTALSLEEFLVQAPLECRKWMQKFDGKCTDTNLAEALGIGTSTLYGYLKRAGLTMKDIRERSRSIDIII